MSLPDTWEQTVEIVATITRETGFPPSPQELAEVLDVPVRALQSHLRAAKHAGAIGYDDDGNFVARRNAEGEPQT